MDRLKVLLADDESTILEGLLRLFDWEAHNLEVSSICGDGVMARNAALEQRPDIMIVDINMPLMSGLEVIRSLVSQIPATAFIILSGYDEFPYAKEALKLRVADYLLKPVRFDELARVLDQVKLDILHKRAEISHDREETRNGDPVLHRVVAYIGDHLKEEISLDRLADEFNMNPTYFSQFFKNKTGMNYYKYLTMVRVNRAKELLDGTERSITEIAADVGIADYRVFSKMFKRQEGMTPSEYRRCIKN